MQATKATTPAPTLYRGYYITPRDGQLLISDGSRTVYAIPESREGAWDKAIAWIDADIWMTL